MDMTADERERQRFVHLVLGRPLPREKKPKKSRRRARSTKSPAPPPLGSVEDRLTLREKWSHKAGTPETLEQHEATERRQGAIARLYLTAAIDADQLAAAESIASAHAAAAADVAIRTASLEGRVDRARDGQFYEALAAVRREISYTRWRDQVEAPKAMLEIIVDDVGLTIVAARHRMGVARTKRLLIDALNQWWRIHAHVRHVIDREALDAVQARVLG